MTHCVPPLGVALKPSSSPTFEWTLLPMKLVRVLEVLNRTPPTMWSLPVLFPLTSLFWTASLVVFARPLLDHEADVAVAADGASLDGRRHRAGVALRGRCRTCALLLTVTVSMVRELAPPPVAGAASTRMPLPPLWVMVVAVGSIRG